MSLSAEQAKQSNRAKQKLEQVRSVRLSVVIAFLALVATHSSPHNLTPLTQTNTPAARFNPTAPHTHTHTQIRNCAFSSPNTHPPTQGVPTRTHTHTTQKEKKRPHQSSKSYSYIRTPPPSAPPIHSESNLMEWDCSVMVPPR
jgi:hypothetical protein